MPYNPTLLKPYLKAKIDNKMPFKNQELYYLCGCENDKQKGSIRALKSQIIQESTKDINGDQIESFESVHTNNTFTSKTSKDYTNSKVKDRFHDQLKISKGHVLELISQYPELPLFIYSKLYERIKKEYPYSDKCKDFEETQPLLTYSFYDMYIELYESINKGDYNQEIEIYMKDSVQSYGDTWCLHRWDKPFNKERLEKRTYWSEKEAKEWLEIQLHERPERCNKYELDLEEAKFLDQKHARSMIEEGSYDTDYHEELDYILEVMSELMTFINEVSDTDNYYSVRSQIAYYFMFIYSHYNDFDHRLKEYVKSDIMKYFIDVKRHGNYPLFYNTLEELYDVYDQRWIPLNEVESCLLSSNAEKIREYIAKRESEIEQKKKSESLIIGELETEYNRLKNGSS